MSYEKVKSICVDDKQKKVFLTTACNNLIPLNYQRWECTSLSKIFSEKGKESVELELLKEYENGNLQQGNNRYKKALDILFYVFSEEYAYFDWRKHNAKYGTPEKEEEDNRRKSKEFYDLLKKSLDYKLTKEKYILVKKYGEGRVYGKITSRHIFWKSEKKMATKFDFKSQAEDVKNVFITSNVEIVEAE